MRAAASAPLRSVVAPALVALLAAACSGMPQPGEDLGQVASPIVDGTASDESQNAVVRLLVEDPSNPRSLQVCTATLLAPDIVITARHCVSRTEDSITCLETNGQLVGGGIFEDHEPENIAILVGTKPDPTATDARGAKIFHDAATKLCGHDLALVVLDRRLASPIAPIRLGAPATTSDRFTAVGWGTNGTSYPSVRQQRANVDVQAIGPTMLDLDTGHRVAVGSNEMLTGEADCSGDSGSPALAAATGAVLGVASRSGIGSSTPVTPCKNSRNVYTVASAFEDVIRAAFAGTGEEVWVEGKPEPPRAAPTSPPSSSSSSGGCAVAPRRERGGELAWYALVLGVALLRRRRVRRSR